MSDAITQIGLIAGEVWHFIDERGGEIPLSEVLASMGYAKEFTLMSVGWLTREGQLFLEEKMGSLWQQLKNNRGGYEKNTFCCADCVYLCKLQCLRPG